MPLTSHGYGLCQLIQGGDILIFTGREVVAKVIFLHLSVILFTGGVSASVHAKIPPPREQTPPRADTPLGADTPLAAYTPPGSRLRHMVNERPVCILLECILVVIKFCSTIQLIFSCFSLTL